MKCKIRSWKCILFLLALLPMQAFGASTYGISDEYDTWQKNYLAQIAAPSSGLASRETNYDQAFSGTGTQDDPFQINTVWDLCRLADWVNGGFGTNTGGINFKGLYFKLNADINLLGSAWYPIGVKPDACFAGYFDGNGHTISNMSIPVGNSDTNTEYHYGFFGCMKGVVRNLNLSNADISIESTSANQSNKLIAGLLCGNMGHDNGEYVFGAVYGCHIEGSIDGVNKNSSSDYLASYVGGIVGSCDNPVSIYKCRADVALSVSDVYAVGGIAGMSGVVVVADGWTNEKLSNGPCVSYIFDCVANVNITAGLYDYYQNHCGGICGVSFNNILACAATGAISSGVSDSGSAASMSDLGMNVGGLTGINGSNIMSCVSMVRLSGGKVVGGLIGENNNNLNDLLVGNVVNCIFSGHIDSPNSSEAHGLVGGQTSGARAPINCMFVGTMRTGTGKPLSNGSTEHCYADLNLYNNNALGNAAYRSVSQLTSALPTLTETITYNNGWKSLREGQFRSVDLPVSGGWEHQSGFYPQLMIGADNLANGAQLSGYKDALLVDYVIEIATDVFGDDASTVRTPSLLPDYAWLASVPAGIHDGLLAQQLDASLSLVAKEQEMETVGDVTKVKRATFSLPAEQTMLTISDETATPEDNVEGDVMLTVTSDGISKQFCLHVNTKHTWDGTTFRFYDGGTGNSGNPYLIHNARQLIYALANNSVGKYYKLTKDIWYNDNLLTNIGEPNAGSSKWDHKSKRDSLNWYGHLDGDGHLIHGLFSTNAFGLVEKIQGGASIENTGFVDCLVWSPESESGTISAGGNPFAFLAPSISSTAAVSNCLFDGVAKDRRSNASLYNCSAFIHTIDGTIGGNPVVEDCVVAVVAKSVGSNVSHTLFYKSTGSDVEENAARRVLVLNNSGAADALAPSGILMENCCSPMGYIVANGLDNLYSPSVDYMTNGTFFAGSGFEKWTVQEGRFPMLTSFSGTSYGKLISLPVYTDEDNRLNSMNYLLDFTPGTATWQTTDNSTLEADKDIRVLEPKKESSSVYLVRSMDEAKVITPITTASSVTKGIRFEDPEAKAFCVVHYDADSNGEISLAELKSITLSQFEDDMNEDDGDLTDNDGENITLFPEFRYFAGIEDLGTSFQDKDKLSKITLSNKITELSDNDFKGTASMTDFTIPVSVTSISGQAFCNSGLENYKVESDHTSFAEENGLLMNKDKDILYSYPSGRKETSIMIPDNVKTISSYAVFKMPQVDTVYIDAKDYDYETVVQLQGNAFTAADGKTIKYFIEDGTQDYSDNDDEGAASRRTDNQTVTDGNGKGHLLSKYQESEFWVNKDLNRYVELTVSSASKDADGNYWATLYCGFDTELPDWMTAYIVDKEETQDSDPTLVLRKVGRQVRMLTPVVIKATKAGDVRLLPSNTNIRYKKYAAYENLLDGVGRNGLDVYQSDANDGGCLTLGKNSAGQVGFFIYKGKARIPAYRAYISVNKVSEVRNMLLEIEEETTDIRQVEGSKQNEEGFYDLKGQRISHPAKGIYIHNSHKYIKK